MGPQTGALHVTHSSKSWFSLEENRVFTVLGGVYAGVQEEAALGDSFKGGRTLIGEPHADKQLSLLQTMMRDFIHHGNRWG